MKVLMVSTSYPLHKGSVSGIFVKRLKTALDERCEVDVVSPDDRNSRESEPGVFRSNYAPKKWQILAHEPGGIPVQIKKNYSSVFLVPSLLLSFFCSVFKRANSYDVIHANWAVSGAISAPACRLFRKVLITTLRGEDVKKRLGITGRFFLRSALKYSHAIVVVSESMLDLLEVEYPEYKHKYRVINNGVDFINMDKPPAVDKNVFDGRCFEIVSVGSLIPRKNVEYSLRELALVKKSGLKFRYRIIGGGVCKPLLEGLSKDLGIDHCVEFVGPVTPNEVAEVLSNSTFLISSSLHEGRPNVVMEAMAAGCCVLLSDIDGHRELIQKSKCGKLFNCERDGGLANTLLDVAQKTESVVNMGHSGRRYIESKQLTWDKSASEYMSCYAELLSSE